jgi:23S rRNA (guanosine2251-2'-O)-methyltransferase
VKNREGGGNFELSAGRKSVLELLLHCPSAVRKVYLSRKAKLSPELNDALSSSGVASLIVEMEQIERLAPDVRHQGIVAELKPRESISLARLLKSGISERRLILVLDQINDPHNFGAILRCAEAAGVLGVVVPKNNSAPITATVRKVSCGASELLPIAKVPNIARSLEELRKAGYWIAGTSLDAESRSLYGDALPMPLAIVLGSEGKGIRELTKKHCDILLQVPMVGKLQSLNVAQTAAVVLFELLRQDLVEGAQQ